MTPPDDLRRAELLTGALQVFSRYGFRKTSMDEVARAVGLSRPGLYLHFPSKEALFRAVVDFFVERSLAAGRQALGGEGALEDRLVAAFVAVNGQHASQPTNAAHLAELLATAAELAGGSITRFERELRADVIAALEPAVGARAAEIADVLDLVSTGAKHRARTPEAYATALRRAVRALLGTPEASADVDQQAP